MRADGADGDGAADEQEEQVVAEGESRHRRSNGAEAEETAETKTSEHEAKE